MYQIIPISDTIKSRYPQLKDYYLCQFLGENQQSAIICSILHYLLNRRKSKGLEYFKSPRINYKQQESQEIVKFLNESMQMENPIQCFFEKLSIYDNNNLMTEVLLQDFCFSYQLMYKGQICLNFLADFLDLNIKIIPQFNSLGRGNSNLIIIQENEEYYFIIPEPQFQLETQVICFNCSRKVYVFIKLFCDHQICWNCLSKEYSQSQIGNFKCRCGQVIQKLQVEQFQNEISIIARTNHFNILLEQFYHQQSSQLVQRKSTIRMSFVKQINESLIEQLTASEIQVSLLNETNRVLEDLDDRCFKCNKESNKPYFYLKDCKHKFCIDCISKEFSNNSCGGCYCFICQSTISRKEYEQYLQLINIEIDQNQIKSFKKDNIENKCCNCFNTFSFRLFTIKMCKHSFCDQCLEQLIAFNYFLDYYCTVSNCPGTFKKYDYENFKQEFRKKVQNSDSQLENTCNQVSLDFNQLNQCKQCLKQLCFSISEIKDQICSDCKNSHLIKKNLMEDESTKITLDDQQEINLNWSLLIDTCQKCLKQSQNQLFQVPLCNHQFCNSCIQSSIQNKQKEQKCLNQECKNLFTRRSYQNYYNNLLQDNEILNNNYTMQNQQQIQNQQLIQNQKLITKSETLKQQSQKQQNQINLVYNSNVFVKSLNNIKSDQQLCSFCNSKSDIDQIFIIKCGHQICTRCSLRQKGDNFRCSKCLTLYDNLKFKQFKQSCKYKCDNCYNIFSYDQILPNQTCRHLLCFQCLQPIYNNKEKLQCSVKSCNKTFNADHIQNFFQNLDYKLFDPQKENPKNNILQIQKLKLVTKQQITELNSQTNIEINTKSIPILPNQTISKKQQQIHQPLNLQSCMICNSDFNDYNLPVYFCCNLHVIGICCILKNYRNCIVCEY